MLRERQRSIGDRALTRAQPVQHVDDCDDAPGSCPSTTRYSYDRSMTNDFPLYRTAWLAIGLAAGLFPGVAAGQDLQFKRPDITALSVACPATPGRSGRAPVAPAGPQHEEAMRLATQGEQAALEGNHGAARDFYSQARDIDASDPSIPFRLAGEDVELADTTRAIAEYCQYLAVTPSAADTARTAERIRAFFPRSALDRGKRTAGAFATGVTRYDTDQWSKADSAFTAVIRDDSTLAPAVFDRGMIRAQMGDKAGAMSDFSRYLALEPNADDVPAVRAKILSLRGPVPSVGTAVAFGFIPGMGQFYTHQPVLGVVVLAAAGGGIAYALQSKRATVTKDTTYTTPFGTPYQGTVSHLETQHPGTVAGFAIAGGVTVFGIIEAAIVAEHRASAAKESAAPAGLGLAPFIAPTSDGRLAFGLSLSP
jgi:hypothetical protein